MSLHRSLRNYQKSSHSDSFSLRALLFIIRETELGRDMSLGTEAQVDNIFGFFEVSMRL